MASGRDEDAVVASLGDPKTFAAQLKVQTRIDRVTTTSKLPDEVKNVFQAVLAILALAPFNFIFVLGPFIGLVGMNIAGWAMSGSLIFVSFLLLLVFLFKLAFFGVGLFTNLSAFFLCLGLVGVGCVGVVAMFWLTRFFMRGTASYLRWNLKMIQGRA